MTDGSDVTTDTVIVNQCQTEADWPVLTVSVSLLSTTADQPISMIFQPQTQSQSLKVKHVTYRHLGNVD